MSSNKEKINKIADETIQMCIEDIENCHGMMNSNIEIVRISGKQGVTENKIFIKELIEIKNRFKIN
jgi:hypothetical protein